MKKQKDVKFIIYQSLYIFVVCVIAIKGANLDLRQVVEDDGTVKPKITQDSLESFTISCREWLWLIQISL